MNKHRVENVKLLLNTFGFLRLKLSNSYACHERKELDRTLYQPNGNYIASEVTLATMASSGILDHCQDNGPIVE